jgi:hypothetical protein
VTSLREVQRPAEGPLLAVLTTFVIAGVFAWFAVVRQVVLDRPALPVWDEAPVSDAAVVVIWVTVGVLLPSVFWLIRQVTEVDERGVTLELRPLRRMTIPHEQIRQVQVVELTRAELARSFRGRRWTLGSQRGVVLSLTDGTNVFVASERPEAVSAAIYRAR